jgi:hypothetical protein
MSDFVDDAVEFEGGGPGARGGLERACAAPIVKAQLLARLAEDAPVPAGFSLRFAPDDDWVPHPVRYRMKVLSVNRRSGFATLLLDVQPGLGFQRTIMAATKSAT